MSDKQESVARPPRPDPAVRGDQGPHLDRSGGSPSASRVDVVAILRVAAIDELARALERDQADPLKMSAQLQRKTVEFGEQRRALTARVSASLLAQYEAAVWKGSRPVVAAARDGACSACGAPLEPGARRRVREGGQIVPCSGCMRLLCDPIWVERDFMPPTLRPLPKADP